MDSGFRRKFKAMKNKQVTLQMLPHKFKIILPLSITRNFMCLGDMMARRIIVIWEYLILTHSSGSKQRGLQETHLLGETVIPLLLLVSTRLQIILLIILDRKLYILGGWLGSGPLAAEDMHILDLKNYKWLDFTAKGEPPGPCNMHTADCYNNKIYVFRGGDGKDYLNDLHELNTLTL